jgi:GT2 family glycosyltransferase
LSICSRPRFDPVSGLEPEETVSLVINTFEQAHFLGAAIGSAMAQSRAFDEIVVVDDGSTDAPERVVNRHPGVRLLWQANAGLAAARNAGLGTVTGRYVVFLDADDLLTPSAVESGLRAHREHPASAFAYGAHRRINGAGEPLGQDNYDPVGGDPYATLLRRNPVGMHATVMYDRALLEASGGFDVSFRRCEDYELYLRLARSNAIVSHPDVVALYRWHGKNMSSDSRTMLRWVLELNDRQRLYTAGAPALEAARREGRRVWKRYYAKDMAQTIRSAWRRGPVWAAIRQTAGGLAFAWPYTAKRLGRLAKGRLQRGRPKAPSVDLGDLATTTPISLEFGYDRGTPIDRFYIADFLERRRGAIRGRALEVGDASYCRLYGGANVTHQDVLHVDGSNPAATIVGDLADPSILPPDAFDCIVLTQTLHLVYDVRQAARQLHAALRTGGTLLLTVPGISPIDRGGWGDTWCWAFTRVSAERLFADAFGTGNVQVDVYGNVFAATAFLQGLAVEEVQQDLLRPYDPAFPVIVAVTARKSKGR